MNPPKIITVNGYRYHLIEFDGKMKDEETTTSAMKIISSVCTALEISYIDLLSHCRKAEIVRARHTVIYLLRDLLGLSLHNIGEIFEQDHTTILNAVRKIEGYIDVNEPYVKPLLAIRNNYIHNLKIENNGQ